MQVNARPESGHVSCLKAVVVWEGSLKGVKGKSRLNRRAGRVAGT